MKIAVSVLLIALFLFWAHYIYISGENFRLEVRRLVEMNDFSRIDSIIDYTNNDYRKLAIICSELKALKSTNIELPVKTINRIIIILHNLEYQGQRESIARILLVHFIQHYEPSIQRQLIYDLLPDIPTDAWTSVNAASHEFKNIFIEIISSSNRHELISKTKEYILYYKSECPDDRCQREYKMLVEKLEPHL